MTGQGFKGFLNDLCIESRAVGADKEQTLTPAQMAEDGRLHAAADVTLYLLLVVVSHAQPGAHQGVGAAIMVDFQEMRLDGGQLGHLANHPLGHLPVKLCGSFCSQCRNKPGLASSGFGITGKKKNTVVLGWYHFESSFREGKGQNIAMKAGKRLKDPESYRTRSYRQFPDQAELVATQVRVQETDLHILATKITTFDLKERATELVIQYRLQLEHYIVKHPLFLATLDPLPMDFLAPPLVREMLAAAQKAGVGPMAAVAGGIAEFVGRALAAEGAREIIVENGGDLYVQRLKECSVAIFAGQSPLSYKVGLRLFPSRMPVGVCTSSGSVGHSLSFGRADAAVVVARSTALADAAATRIGNEVKATLSATAGVERALAKAREIEGIEGAVVICGEVMGAMGAVELVRLGS